MTALRKNLKRAGIEMYIHTKMPIHIHYCRYADDFLVGVQGNKELTQEICKKISDMLKSSLHLTVSKAEIKHTRSDKTPFLGFLLSLGVLGPRTKGRTLERFKRLKARYKVLRKSEYIRYLKMLREAEKRYWTRTLETEARRVNQTMMKKTQMMEATKKLCTRNVLETLQECIQEMKEENEKNNAQGENLPLPGFPHKGGARERENKKSPIDATKTDPDPKEKENPRYAEALEAKNTE